MVAHGNMVGVDFQAPFGAFSIWRGAVTLIDLMAIALRYTTAMSDAMVDACIERAGRTGEPLFAPQRGRRARRGKRPTEEIDWEKMVRGNRGPRPSWKR